MSFKYIQGIPTPEEIRQDLPMPEDLRAAKAKRDEEIRKVFTRESDRFILIVGPCSADQEDAVCEYVSRLAKLQDLVADKLLFIPRIYTNKPRTTGEGYKGMAHTPDPRKEPNMVAGLKSIRRMHIRAFSESHLAAADEMLYPGNFPYLEDILGYVAVGARSVENQEHRLTASGLNVPVGMKNPTGGDIGVMLNAIYAAQLSHVFSYNNWEVSTEGNPFAHAVLRGSVDLSNRNVPNYHYEDLSHIADLYEKRAMKNPSIIVDTNHSNSNKHYDQQPRIGLEVCNSRKTSERLARMVRGLLMESYLEDGAQKVNEGVYGKSITDPCLGWERTERFVKDLADAL